jgi:hypothetical protein
MRVFTVGIERPLNVSVQCPYDGRAVEFHNQEQGFDRGLPLLEILLALGSFWM